MRKIGFLRRQPFMSVLGTASLLLGASGAWAAQVTAIEFKDEGGASVIEIKGDGPLEYEKQESAKDKQLVLDLKSASLTKQSSRILDTSSFNSRVSLVSPYAIGSGARIVIQLRKSAAAEVSSKGNVIRVKFPGTNDAAAAPQAPAGTDESGDKSAPAESAAAPPEGPPPSKGPDPRERPKDQIDEFLEARETRRFIGRPITLQVRDADVVDVFRLIGEASGFNIVIGEGVSGKITLSLTDVPWDQALDVIFKTKRLGAERSNNLLRIVTLAALTSEKQEELRAKQAAEVSAPRITRIFPISYARIDELRTMLSKFAVASSAQAGGGTPSASTTIVEVDTRTNSLIVRDTPENIERIRKLIEVLDTQTPQILIEGKVIEANESFSRNISAKLGLTGAAFGGPGSSAANPNFGASFLGGNTGTFSLPTSGSNEGAIGISPYTGFFPSIARLNAELRFREEEGMTRTIASPRSVVLNKESTTITSSDQIKLVTPPQVQGAPSNTTLLTANTSLNVTPTVGNDSNVLLQITLTRDVPRADTQTISGRTMSTKVIVPSGNTLMIGGVYSASETMAGDGFPWLRKIPILGIFFGNSQSGTARTELLFFITPRILNAGQAGLGT